MSIHSKKTTNKKPEVVTPVVAENKAFSIVWRFSVVNVMFFLFLLSPQMLIAETNTKNDHVRAQEIMANAPKSSEEFLARLKTLLQNQNNNGLNFAEKLTGIGMDRWKTNPYSKNDVYRPYSFNLWRDGLWKDIDVDKWPPLANRPTISFSFGTSLGVDDYRDNVFFDFQMTFNTTRKRDDFQCFTPKITQKILGKPSKILSYIDDKTENSHSSQLMYKYKTNGYKVRIQYEINDDIRSTIGYDRILLEDFNNHQNLCASKVTVSRANPFKLQNSGADSEWVQEISAKVPKNSNEFIRRLKSSWENQKSNVFAFAEETTGVSMSKWMKIQNEGLLRYHLFIPPDDLEDYPDFPYVFFVKSATDNSLFRANLQSFKHKYIVCITPAQTKEILGEPSKISGYNRRSMEGSWGWTNYIYEKENTTLEFRYPDPGGKFIQYMDFNQHKNFCADSIELKQK